MFLLMKTMRVVAFLFGVCCPGILIEAMIVTRYEKVSAPVTSDFTPCAVSAASTDHCAARVTTDNKCEPLTKDWCDAKDMSTAGSYFIKRTIIQMLESTLTNWHDQPIPIQLSEGSEVEIKFKLHTGWSYLLFDLMESASSDLIYVWITQSSFWFDGSFNGTYTTYDIVDHNGSVVSGVKYTLRLVRVSNTFQVYFDGGYIATFPQGLPIDTLPNVRINFWGADGDLYQVAYRAGV